MSTTYKYFCNDCGHKFISPLPERNERGLLNSICCPHCGSWDIYPDNKQGADESVAALNRYEATLIAWED